jgi:predicted CopG family antitoxin
MKKKLTLTIDDDVYEGIKELPRKVSISEVVSWVLRAMVEDVKPDGMTEDEFIRFMDNDPRGKEVRKFLQEKISPILEKVNSGIKRFEKAKKMQKVTKRGGAL